MREELGDQSAFIGIDAIGYEEYNDSFAEGVDLPLLQDDTDAEVWTRWGAEWRDVWVLDSDSVLVEIYNLNEHNLAEDAGYQGLVDLMQRAAAR